VALVLAVPVALVLAVPVANIIYNLIQLYNIEKISFAFSKMQIDRFKRSIYLLKQITSPKKNGNFSL
ncbi:hypothetical protein, partial [Bacillus sp. 491mf]|uniref:hypothetical protein n=1 Tax=Bacillus sp. 491mf TaxID=1761755 RepID=UPI001C42F16B